MVTFAVALDCKVGFDANTETQIWHKTISHVDILAVLNLNDVFNSSILPVLIYPNL